MSNNYSSIFSKPELVEKKYKKMKENVFIIIVYFILLLFHSFMFKKKVDLYSTICSKNSY